MTNSAMKIVHDVVNPFKIQPATPSATTVWKKIFLLSLWSAKAPQTVPSKATMTVTTEIDME